jgi:4'-phosphopantetheinyl transferase
MVVLAVARRQGIGVDVERWDRALDHLNLANSVFARPEIQRLRRTAGDVRAQVFTTLWTLKEAYAKALGLGLTFPFREFWFDLDGQRPTIHQTLETAAMPHPWYFQLFAPSRSHRVALAVSMANLEESIRILPREVVPLNV